MYMEKSGEVLLLNKGILSSEVAVFLFIHTLDTKQKNYLFYSSQHIYVKNSGEILNIQQIKTV